jgi:hypothetical protein
MHRNALSNAKYKWLACYGLRMCSMLWAAKQFTNEDADTTDSSMYVNVIL